MNALPAPVAAKLGKLIGRLGSDHDGEVVATGRAIQRTLVGAGLDLHALAAHIAAPPSMPTIGYRDRPPPRRPAETSWRNTWSAPNGTSRAGVERVQRLGKGRLSAWEKEFVASLERRLAGGLALTPKQQACLVEIERKLEGRS